MVCGKDLSAAGVLLHLAILASLGSAQGQVCPRCFRRYGQRITYHYPNDEFLAGLGGLAYDPGSQVWTMPAEEVPGYSFAAGKPMLTKPRIYRVRLDFLAGNLSFAEPPMLVIRPDVGLSLEDIFRDPVTGAYWLVSEANSHGVGSLEDLNSYSPETYEHSRVFVIDASGRILEEGEVPHFVQWDRKYSWAPGKCSGERGFRGFHASGLVPGVLPDGLQTAVIGIQSALFQDGLTATEFEGARTRLLFFDLNGTSLKYSRSYRYDTSPKTIKTLQKSARHFVALFGLIPLSPTSLLMGEVEELTSSGETSITSRVFHVELDPRATVDHCQSLRRCDVPAPRKKLVWEEQSDALTLDGMTRGPDVEVDGVQMPTAALVHEGEGRAGPTFDLFAFDAAAFAAEPYWAVESNKEAVRSWRWAAVVCGVGLIAVAFLVQLALVRLLAQRGGSQPPALPQVLPALPTAPQPPALAKAAKQRPAAEEPTVKVEMLPEEPAPGPSAEPEPQCELTAIAAQQRGGAELLKGWGYKHYVMASAVANSVFLGGLVWGFPGMALIIRKEGLFARNCVCATFCVAQQQEFGSISTFGLSVCIGARLFLGVVMDHVGPKIVAVACSLICAAACLCTASVSRGSESGEAAFMAFWLLLGFGGGGLHLTGFHCTNLFGAAGKKVASTLISGGFGASPIILSLAQLLSQYGDASLQGMSAFYAVVALLLAVNNFLVMPWRTLTPGATVEPLFNFWEASWWAGARLAGPKVAKAAGAGPPAKPAGKRTLREILTGFSFLGELVFFCVNLFALTHYLSTVAQLMHTKGDTSFSEEPNSFMDYAFTRLAGVFNSLGLLWLPTVQLALTRLPWSMCFLVQLAFSLLFLAVLLVPMLEVQVIAFALQSVARLMVFGFHFAYIADEFGFEHFGLLNGISSFVAAVFGLLSTPLQVFTVHVAGGDATPSILLLAGGVLLSAAFPVALRYREVQEAKLQMTLEAVEAARKAFQSKSRPSLHMSFC